MKKSASVPLTLVAGVAAVVSAGCNRQRAADPCKPESFNEQVCQEAVANRGYYSHGTWIPMVYSYPYPYYYDSYRGYTSRGGIVRTAPSTIYSRPSSGSVTRGGFGSSGYSGSSYSSRGFGS